MLEKTFSALLPGTTTTVRRNAELGRMDTINRSAVIVTPAKPFLDWLHRVDPTSAEARGVLEKDCEEIFENQLDGWFRVPSA